MTPEPTMMDSSPRDMLPRKRFASRCNTIRTSNRRRLVLRRRFPPLARPHERRNLEARWTISEGLAAKSDVGPADRRGQHRGGSSSSCSDGPEVRWGHWDLNPDWRVSSVRSFALKRVSDRGITGRRSSRSSTVSKPTCRHSCATGARSTTRLYYTPLVNFTPSHCVVHACGDGVSSSSTSSVADPASSTHGSLASWGTSWRPAFSISAHRTPPMTPHDLRSARPNGCTMLIDVGCSRGSAYRMVTSVMTARSVCNSRPWSPSFAEKMTPPESPNIPMGWLQLLPLLMSFTM